MSKQLRWRLVASLSLAALSLEWGPTPASAQGPVISEFMAVNGSTLLDEDGSSSDWIEIFNPGATSVNLQGWSLTDSANNLTKWQIPAITLPPQEFLVVFASGKNRATVSGTLHTSFSLSEGGEYLGLIQPDGTTVSSDFRPAYPGQASDLSYGRRMSGTILLPGGPVYLYPTPGRPNSSEEASQAAGPVRFVPPSRTSFAPFHLILNVSSNSTIYYDLVYQGQTAATATNLPSRNSTRYLAPILIDRPVQVRARSYSPVPGAEPGPVTSGLYLFAEPNLDPFRSTLPIVVIDTIGPMPLPPALSSPAASAVVALFDNTTGTSSVGDAPALVKRAGVRVVDSVFAPKANYALTLWDENNQPEKRPVLGLPEESEWVLYASSEYDPGQLHHPLAFELSRGTGRYAPRTRFVEVFVKTNGTTLRCPNPAQPTPANAGHYVGIYVLEEKIKRDRNRVDIDALTPAHESLPEITGGYLFRNGALEPGDRVLMGAQTTLIHVDPSGPALSQNQLAYLQGYFTQFNNSIFALNYTSLTGAAHYTNFFDVDAAIDFHLVNVLCLNPDALSVDAYFYKPRHGRITMGPVWNFSRALGSSRTDSRSFNPLTWSPPIAATDYFNSGAVPWWSRCFNDPDFFQRWIDRYQELRAGPWTTNEVARMVDQLAARILEARPREESRWRGLGSSDTSPRTNAVTVGAYSHSFNGTYAGEMEFQRRWLLDRMQFMDTQFLARPLIITETAGTDGSKRVSLADVSGRSGTALYYTLDGSDPLASRGTTNTSAQRYTGPFLLRASAAVAARAVNRTSFAGNLTGSRNPPLRSFWSGVTSAIVPAAPPTLNLTEIHYHPMAPPAPSAFAADDYQFLELKNFGSVPVRLGGLRFTDGVTFNFPATNLPAGAYAVVARNRVAFEERYGAGRGVVGEFSGALSLGGEHLSLVDIADRPVFDLDYTDAWYDLTDGAGLSLVAALESEPGTDLSTRRHWRPSRLLHGSPGATEPTSVPIAPVVINELLSNPVPPYEDAVELFNPTGDYADVSFWFLSDEYTQPKKFRIPPGTILPALSYLAFDEHSFNPEANLPLPTSFAFSPGGEAVYLYSANQAGDLTGYVHGFRFGAARPNESFARYVAADGTESFVPQSQITLAGTNASPVAPPLGQKPTLAVTEIMFSPKLPFPHNPSDFEFIELKNIGDTPVDLGRAEWVAGIQFIFPVYILEPGRYALLVRSTNAFASRYGTNLPVVGQFSGGLATEGERLALVGATGEPIVDFVYDGTPFPLTRGLGFALVPVDENMPRTNYSNVLNWRTGTVEGGTPGRPEPPIRWSPIEISEVTVTPFPPVDPFDEFARHDIELYNPGSNAVDVTRWRITGLATQPIPGPAVVPPRGFLVIPGLELPSLRRTSQSIYCQLSLLSADPASGELTGFYHSIDFGPGIGGVPFGPYVTSDGRREIVAYSAPTPGAVNAPPRVGPVVISEINYHPPDVRIGSSWFDNTADEYIELHNITASPVMLFDPFQQGAPPWFLSGALSFEFPSAVLPAYSRALLVSFDPANTAESNRFAQVHFLPAGVPVFGPWTGELKNSAATINLMARFQDDSTLVDRIAYEDSRPWPAATDGEGASLQRIDLTAFGNDPVNWRAAWPSAGRDNVGGIPPTITRQPEAATALVGGTAEFQVTAVGGSAYRWFFNNDVIPGATNDTLRLENLPFDASGTYRVVVFGSGGVTASEAVSLIVKIGAAIQIQPADVAVRIPPDPGAAPTTNATFQVAATSANPPVSFQWRFNGQPMVGATTPSFTVTNVTVPDAGDYTCAITDSNGTVVSRPARLSPLITPTFITTPLNQRIITGAMVNVSVVVTGFPPPFIFEWRVGTTARLTNLNVHPIDFVSLEAPSILVTDFLSRIVVKNQANLAPGVSVPFFITTLADTDGDGLPDEFEAKHGLNPADAADGALDGDGDGMTNSAEYSAGTNPGDPSSYLRIDPAGGGGSGSPGPTISFLAVSNRTYKVESRHDATAGLWRNVADIVATATNRPVTVQDPIVMGTNTARVYRLVTPRQP